MKRSGRTIKQRLYGLKHLPSRIKRARYFRGHGVHSPFVYNIVRKVFMRSTLMNDTKDIFDALRLKGVSKRRAIELQNLATHCQYTTWSIDDSEQKCDLVFATLDTPSEMLTTYARRAHRIGATLCIIAPYYDATRWEICNKLIEEHTSTSVDNRAYLLLFNNRLPLQRFRL